MKPSAPLRVVAIVFALLAFAAPSFAQIELSGAYASRMYEDYIERGPGRVHGQLHRHAAERRRTRQGAALHVEPCRPPTSGNAWRSPPASSSTDRAASR